MTDRDQMRQFFDNCWPPTVERNARAAMLSAYMTWKAAKAELDRFKDRGGR